MKCPHCGGNIKGHANGTKTFRELTRAQQRAAIAKTTCDLTEMRAIYDAAVTQTNASRRTRNAAQP